MSQKSRFVILTPEVVIREPEVVIRDSCLLACFELEVVIREPGGPDS